MSHRTRQCFSSLLLSRVTGSLCALYPQFRVLFFVPSWSSAAAAPRDSVCHVIGGAMARVASVCPWRRALAPAACHLEAVWAVVVGLLFPSDRWSSSFNQSCVTFRLINKSQVLPQVPPCLLVSAVTIDTRPEDDTHAPR